MPDYSPHAFGEYDLEQLEAARRLLLKVYNYHCGDSYVRKELGRLETIINKIDTLQMFNQNPAQPTRKENHS